MEKSKTASSRNVVLAVIVSIFVMVVLAGCAEDSDDPTTVDFTVSPTWGQAALPVAFSDESVVGSDGIISYLWDFGDGAVSTEKDPDHLYSRPGRYTVTLTVSTTAGELVKKVTDCISVSDNEVMVWNALALEAISAHSWMPPQAARGLAMLHAGIYDAVNAVEQRGDVYRASVDVIPGTYKEAAVTAAAHRILTDLFPDQAGTFDRQFMSSLAVMPDGAGKSNGISVGEAIADIILSWREGDGSKRQLPPFTGGSDPGQWRPTPPDYLPGMFTHWSGVTPFALASKDQFRPASVPELNSIRYTDDFNEVKEIGRKASESRTMEQSMIANFWVGMPGTITEVGRMNQVIQQAAENNHLSLYERARLFALVNIAMADGAIAGVDCKYYFNAWRPITAIQEAAGDGNDFTTADPSWESYIMNPAHPDYISTHSTLTMAGAEVLIHFFGSDQADITLPAFMDETVTRSYDSYSGIAHEASISRLYGGIHFRFSLLAGLELGEQIGRYVFENIMVTH